jgi:pilus assembly protein CpaB
MQSRVLAILIAVVLALVATTAMIVYVKSADQRAINGQQPVHVLVAKKTIPKGMTGEDALNSEGMIDRVEIPAKYALRGRVLSEEQLRNRYAAVPIAAGEQLLLERWVGAEDVGGRDLLTIPEGHKAVSVGVDLVRQVAGFVTPGDRVSVAVTMPDGDKGDKTQYVLPEARVLAVGATALTRAAQGNGGRVNQGKGSQTLTAVTLAVKTDEAVKKVIFAAEEGSIYLALLPPNAEESTGPPGPAADESTIFGKP